MKSEIVHFEIPAKNPEMLSKFYKKVFGWKFKDSGMTGMKYWLISTGGKSGGGMYKKESAYQAPVNYIGTSDIDRDIRSIKGAGGKIVVGKQEIPKMGWSAIAKDPEGNAVGLFQPMMKGTRRK